MMWRRRHAKYPPGTGTAGSDIEALQTDVMRFMSIIGLCLMAVFALVQGIPVQEKGKTALLLQAARLREEVRVKQLKVQELQAMLQVFKTDTQHTQRMLAAAEQDLDQVASQTQKLRDARDRLETQMEILERQLSRGRQELTDIGQAAMQKEQDLAELEARLSDVQDTLERSRRKIVTLKRQSRPIAPDPAIEERPEPVRAAPLPVRQGFTLRFVSDVALDTLVAAGSVTLYAMANRQAWRLSLDTGRLAVARGPYPGWFHEMSAVTVPEHYIQGLENAPDGPGRSDVVWGVQLPASTRETIALLTHGQQGGELVIRGDGQVVLRE